MTFRIQIRPAFGLALAVLGTLAFMAVGTAERAGAAKPVVALRASAAAVDSGKAVRLAGVVRRVGTGRRAVLLARAGGGGWARAGARVLPRSGRFAFAVRPRLGRTLFRVVVPRAGRAPGGASRPARVLVRPAVFAKGRLAAGDRANLGGWLPTAIKRRVILQRRVGGAWRATAARFSNAKGFVAFPVTVAGTATVYRLLAPRAKTRVAVRRRAAKRNRGGAGRSARGGAGRRNVIRTRVLAAFASPPVAVRGAPRDADGVSEQSVGLDLPGDVCTDEPMEAEIDFSPSLSGGSFALQVADGGDWETVASGGQGSGGASAQLRAPEFSGTYEYRAVATTGAGESTGTSATEEVEVRACVSPPPLPQIYGGSGHSCEIDAFGVTWCWGANDLGQLGDGSETERTKPVEVAGGHDFVDLALGARHTCGIVASGKAYCWGGNTMNGPDDDSGALGDGTETNRDTPTAVSGGHSFVKLSAGNGMTCGLTGSGAAYCWGRGLEGQLGNGNSESKLTPTRVSGGGFDDIEVGDRGACGLSGGQAYCWGTDHRIYRGLPKEEGNVPTPVNSHPDFKSIAVGSDWACGLTAAGVAHCWGDNDYGVLGRGETGPTLHSSPDPAPVSGGHEFTDIEAGVNFACGRAPGGSVLCWGNNNFGHLGQGDSDLDPHTQPGEVSGGHNFIRLGLGSGHGCGIDSGGFAWCWGFNHQGQLGVGVSGNLDYRPIPNTVLFPGVE